MAMAIWAAGNWPEECKSAEWMLGVTRCAVEDRRCTEMAREGYQRRNVS